MASDVDEVTGTGRIGEIPRDRAIVGTKEEAVERARTAADLLDEAVTVPGTDFEVGLDPILGVLPVAGDSAAAAASLYVVAEAVNAGAPPATVARMLAIVGVDAVVGSIPFVGPLFDAVWKANKWNVAALERHVEAGPAQEMQAG